MMNERFIGGFTGIVISIFFVGTFAYAASTIPGTDGFKPIEIELSTQTPEPFEKITARAESVRYDLNRMSISWFINDKQVGAGIGKTSIDFKTGDAGTITDIRITVAIPSVGAISQTISVKPASVDLLWQSNVYVPPFYRGKALASSAAELTIVAMPNISNRQGRKIPAKELVYNWKLGDKTLVSQSGYGKDAITITGARIYGDAEVSVEASSLDGSILAKKFLFIQSIDPKLVFYENHPL